MNQRKPYRFDEMDLMMATLDAQMRGKNPTDGVLDQEAADQRDFVSSDTLPANLRGTMPDPKAFLTTLGFKFGDTVPGDDLFQYVTLPEGWRKVATDHSMWSSVVDEKGRERLSVFYKAPFYDRDAFANIVDGQFD